MLTLPSALTECPMALQTSTAMNHGFPSISMTRMVAARAVLR